jgi:tetratricopeptide (TPR) repeat protein
MRAASVLHALEANPGRALDLARNSLELFGEIDDPAGMISARIALSLATYWNGDYRQSVALAEELLPICRAQGDRFSEAQLLDAILGEVAFIQGDYARAAGLHEQSLTLRRTFRDTDGLAWTLFLLGRNLHALGDAARARALYEESRGLWQQLGHRRWSADVLDKLGTLACGQGDYAQARVFLEESMAVARRFGDSDRTACALCDLAMLACAENNVTQAQIYIRQVAVLMPEPACVPLQSKFFLTAARLAFTTGDMERAARLVGAAQAAPKDLNARLGRFNPAEHETLQTAMHSALGADRLDQMRTAGYSMSLETALAYATQAQVS